MYELNHYLQDAVLKLMIEEKEFLRRGAIIIDPIIFTEPVRKIVCRKVLDFYSSYQDAPGYEIFLIEEKKDKKNIEKELLIYLENLLEMSVNRDFVLSELNSFVRKMELVRVLDDSEELLRMGRLDEIEKRLYSTLNKGIKDLNLGRDYLLDGLMAYSKKEYNKGVIIGIDRIDRKGLENKGLEPERVACFMGAPKGKKSWTLVHMVIQAALQGFRVLLVSCELNTDEIIGRLDTIISRKELAEILNDPQRIIAIRKKIMRFGGGIRIKDFPNYSITVRDIEASIDQLELVEGFSPNVVIIDYADLLKPEEKYKEGRDKYDDVFKGLKRMSSVRKILIITATQAVRASIKRNRKWKWDVSEDIRKMAHVDYMFGLSHPTDKLADSVLRVDLVANRTGEEGFFADVRMDLKRGIVFGESISLGGDDREED